jgi:CRISPR system Cascade subunit CasB
MTRTTRVPPSADKMVSDVSKITADNPGDRSVLRHSLGLHPRNVAPGVHRLLTRYVPEHDDAAERAYYLVAALIASQDPDSRNQAREEDAADSGPGDAAPGTHQQAAGWRRQNFGHSLALAADKRPLDRRKPLEDRLELLARQDIDGLCRHLPRLVFQLRKDKVRIDWGAMVRDLTRWDSDPRQVAKEWVQDYYRASERLESARKRNNGKAADPRQEQEQQA